jgi:hypothetical protein
MADWSAEQIILVSVSLLVALAALVASAVAITDARMRARETAADLEKTAAELGVQREAASALERSLRCRDAFIDRNVLLAGGPEGFSAAAPEVEPELVGSMPWLGDGGGEVFVVGSDTGEEESMEEEDGDSDSDSGIGSSEDGHRRREDDGTVCPVLHPQLHDDEDGDGPGPRSPTAVSAVRVRPNDIKTVILRRPQPRREEEEANRGGAVAQWLPQDGGNFAYDDESTMHSVQAKPT